MRTFLKGRILFNNGASNMDCLIRDLSGTGARLELSETTALPEVFDLYIQHKDQTFRSTLRWRRSTGVGVTFEDVNAKPAPEPLPEPKAAGEPTGTDSSLTKLAQRIAELEAENAALRSAITSMSRATTSDAA